MEVINKCKAFLSNFEVKQMLENSQEAQSNFKKKNYREDENLAIITYETLKYLKDTRVKDQTAESVVETTKKLSKFPLTKLERLILINCRPVNEPELYCMVEDMDERQEQNPIMDPENILKVVAELPYVEEEEEEESEEDQEDEEELVIDEEREM